MLQKGQTLLIVLLLLILVIGGAGYYLYSQGFLSQMIPKSPQAVETAINSSEEQNEPTVAPSKVQENVTSGSIKLNVTYPTNGLVLKSTIISVTGITTPAADVFVNDQETKADAKGNFLLKITLDEGINNIVVAANDDTGNVSEQSLSVNVQTF